MSVQVWAGMATLLERAPGRAAAIESLLPQVDRLTVSPGDGRGDGAKFDSCADAPGVFFSVDDDLVYPPDYVERTLAALERHPGAIVTYHGSVLDANANRRAGYRCLGTVRGEHWVDLPGTGVAAFYASTIRPTPADFPGQHADWWLAVKARREGVRCVVLPHEAGWLGYVPPPRTIWDETYKRTGSAMDASASIARAQHELKRLMRGGA